MNPYSPEGATSVSADYLRQNPRAFKPHVVILGSGASIQSFPSGDKYGKRLPGMENLIKVVGISDKVLRLGLTEDVKDFELVYSRLFSQRRKRSKLKEIESDIYEYFSKMALHEYPTLYDHLLLSLSSNDLIATFNWDPLIFDSWERLSNKFGSNLLPQIAFLHGNVRVGYCLKDNTYGRNGRVCPFCHKKLQATPLLYPIENKNYESDLFIKDAWQKLQEALRDAFAVTILGYGAPNSDKAAIAMMKDAWNGKNERKLETIFIIDIKKEDELKTTWSPFFFSHHFRIHKRFYDSWLPRHARRSIEALIVPTLEGCFVDDLPIQKDASWSELEKWFLNLTNFEKKRFAKKSS